MPRTLKITLLSVGMILICLSLFLLAYMIWPGETTRIQATLSPTLFAPP